MVPQRAAIVVEDVGVSSPTHQRRRCHLRKRSPSPSDPHRCAAPQVGEDLLLAAEVGRSAAAASCLPRGAYAGDVLRGHVRRYRPARRRCLQAVNRLLEAYTSSSAASTPASDSSVTSTPHDPSYPPIGSEAPAPRSQTGDHPTARKYRSRPRSADLRTSSSRAWISSGGRRPRRRPPARS